MFKNEIAQINAHDSETARMTSKAIKLAMFENNTLMVKSLIEGFNQYQEAVKLNNEEIHKKVKAAQAFYLNY
jgi:hypothetical protein